MRPGDHATRISTTLARRVAHQRADLPAFVEASLDALRAEIHDFLLRATCPPPRDRHRIWYKRPTRSMALRSGPPYEFNLYYDV